MVKLHYVLFIITFPLREDQKMYKYKQLLFYII